VKRTLHAVEVATPAEAAEQALPEEVKLSLAEIAGAAKEGLLALATGTGLAVLHEAMEHEGEEDVVVERMLCGVSARRAARAGEPVGAEVEKARSTSKSAVSRRVVEGTQKALDELMSRRLEDVRLAALMIQGRAVQYQAPGAYRRDRARRSLQRGDARDHPRRHEGPARAVGLTENATVATALLSDLAERGLDCSGGVLWSSTAPRRWARRSARCSAGAPSSSAASATRRETWPTTFPSASGRG
jgi:hypothetical protein